MTGITISESTLLFAALVSLVFYLTPGPAVLYVVTSTTAGGIPSGVLASLGLTLGTLVQATISGSVILSASLVSPVVLRSLQITGAVYLVYLGARQLARHLRGPREANLRRPVTNAPFLIGVLINVSNPKALLFFVALVPQFFPAGATPVLADIAILLFVIVLIGLACDLFWAIAGSLLFRRSAGLSAILEYAAPCVLILIGLLAVAAFAVPG